MGSDKQFSIRHRNALPPRGEQDKIARYLALMTPGGTLTSNFLAMCEVSSEYQVRSVKCGACRGLGARDGDPFKIATLQSQLSKPNITAARASRLREKLSGESQCRACSGTGYREKKANREQFDPMFTTVRCGKCRGCGDIVAGECTRCLGDACVVPITARVVGSSGGGGWGGGSSMDETWLPPAPEAPQTPRALELLSVGELLRLAESEGPQIAGAVRAYHGEEGDRWAPHRWGRTFALWPETAAGRALAELAASRPQLRGAGHLIRPIDRIASEREAESRKGAAADIRRRALLRQADTQARLLRDAMQRALESAEARVG